MCHKCDNDKGGLTTLLAVISGIVLVAAAVSAAVYFILKFLEKKDKCDYIECDCYGDYDGYDAFDDDEPTAEVAADTKADESEPNA